MLRAHSLFISHRIKSALLMGALAAITSPAPILAEAPRAPVCGAVTTAIENNTPVAITDNAVKTSTVTVSGAPTFIWDVDLRTFITHTFGADLDITLTSPAGTIVTITSDNAGGFNDTFNGTLWDDSANPGGSIPHVTSGNLGLATDNTYSNNVVASNLVPEEPLAAFYGEDPNGIWTLRVSDDAGADTGSLARWGLSIVSLPELPTLGSVSAAKLLISVPITDNVGAVASSVDIAGGNGMICGALIAVKVPHASSGDLQLTLSSPAGTVVTLTSNNGGTNQDVFSNTLFSNRADLGNQVPFSSGTFATSNLATDSVYTTLVAKTVLTPEESLGAFFGQSPNGRWTLAAADTNLTGTGTLKDWAIQFNTCRPALDFDNDLFGDACDGCPSDSNKSSPGVCGCGAPEILTDADGDGTVDCLDLCVIDPAKITPAVCGCGIADVDQNGNGITDCLLNRELSARASKLRSLIGKLKPSNSANGKKKLSANRKLVSTNLKELLSFGANNTSGLSVKPGSVTVSALLSRANKAVKLASRKLTSSSRSKASKALRNLDTALAS